MPVTYDIDPETGVVHTRCAGYVTFDEVLAHFRELENDESLPDRVDVLLDLTLAESAPDSQQIRSIAGEVERLRSKLSWGACAIVAPADVLYGMTRMFQVFAEDFFTTSSVFREREKADRWLVATQESMD
jgi:hypothetical protein